MEIKEINEQNLALCAKLYADVFSGEPWNENWTIELALTRIRHFYLQQGFVGFFTESDNPIGMVLGNIEPFYEGDMFYLREMCIRKEFQGQGIGHQLIQHLEAKLKSLSVKSMYASTNLEFPAARFFEKSGMNQSSSMGFFSKLLD